MSPGLLAQTLLNQYRVDAFIALTPSGDYYRVWDTWHNKPYGMIVLSKEIADDPEALKHLETDSNSLRNLSFPNLIPSLGFYQTQNLAFFIEEWVDGPSLRAVLTQGRLEITETFVYAKSLCTALAGLHKKGLLHLNIAPEVIRLDARGNIYLGCIGTARHVGERVPLPAGKYPALYAAPEQFLGEPLAPAADIYSLAVILYEMVTGAWLMGKTAAKSADQVRAAHLTAAPPAPIELNPAIPDHFSRLLLWALRKKSGDRLSTTTELLSTLALAASLDPDKIPLRADPKTAPVTAAALSSWSYLPLPPPSILEAGKPPLEDRLAATTVPPPRKPKAHNLLGPAIIFLSVAAMVVILLQMRPADLPILTPAQNTPFAVDYIPSSTATSPPIPTSVHGRRIVFTCTRGDYNQLCIINFDGTGLQQLSHLEADDYYPVFSPSGDALLFASNRNGVFDLYSLHFNDKELFQLTDHIGNVVSPDYSPDGRKIVFANYTADGPMSIWIANADGLNPHLLYKGSNTIVAAAWSPNGEQIAYAMSMGIPNEYEIFVMDAAGRNHRRVSIGLLGIGGSISWSPDNKYLLIYAGPVGDKDIFRLDIETSESVQLTDGGNNAAGAYSPDGGYIAFNSMRNDGQADLYIMKADGSLLRRLTNDPEPDWGPRWEP